jgi:hypothetical protein
MLITAVDWSVSWEIEVLVESLLAAKVSKQFLRL